MPFVDRNESGDIIGVYICQQYEGQEFLEVATLYIPPQIIIVSPRQIRQAMTALGLRTMVETAIAASDQDTKDWYEFATSFEEDHVRVSALASALSITPEQVHSLFVLAASL